jgi:hypothetical protein
MQASDCEISQEQSMTTTALPPVVDADTWQRQLEALRSREKAAWVVWLGRRHGASRLWL